MSDLIFFNTWPNLFFLFNPHLIANTNKTPTHVQIYKANSHLDCNLYTCSSVCTISWQTFVKPTLNTHTFILDSLDKLLLVLDKQKLVLLQRIIIIITMLFGFVVVFFFHAPPSLCSCFAKKVVTRSRRLVFIFEHLNVCLIINVLDMFRLFYFLPTRYLDKGRRFSWICVSKYPLNIQLKKILS